MGLSNHPSSNEMQQKRRLNPSSLSLSLRLRFLPLSAGQVTSCSQVRPQPSSRAYIDDAGSWIMVVIRLQRAGKSVLTD